MRCLRIHYLSEGIMNIHKLKTNLTVSSPLLTCNIFNILRATEGILTVNVMGKITLYLPVINDY